MTLPLLISIPHGGNKVPDFLAVNFLLSPGQIEKDGDEYSDTVYAPLAQASRHRIRSDIARAVLDMNRDESDLSADGVVKRISCWDEAVWKTPLAPLEIERLLHEYHRPYHARLSRQESEGVIKLGIDCHTMAAHGPPTAADAGARRPWICLGDADGKSCPRAWVETLLRHFEAHFPGEASLNRPFSGGYITRRHAAEMPWIQLEISRGDYASPREKGRRVLAAVAGACEELFS